MITGQCPGATVQLTDRYTENILKSCRLGKEKKRDLFYTETERVGRFQVEVRDWLETEQEEDRNVHIWTYMDHGA